MPSWSSKMHVSSGHIFPGSPSSKSYSVPIIIAGCMSTTRDSPVSGGLLSLRFSGAINDESMRSFSICTGSSGAGVLRASSVSVLVEPDQLGLHDQVNVTGLDTCQTHHLSCERCFSLRKKLGSTSPQCLRGLCSSVHCAPTAETSNLLRRQ